MERFSYRTETFTAKELSDQLNEYGKSGWELVSVEKLSGTRVKYFVILKKRIA